MKVSCGVVEPFWLIQTSILYVPSPAPVVFHVRVGSGLGFLARYQLPPGIWKYHVYTGCEHPVALAVYVTTVPTGCGDALSGERAAPAHGVKAANEYGLFTNVSKGALLPIWRTQTSMWYVPAGSPAVFQTKLAPSKSWPRVQVPLASCT